MEVPWEQRLAEQREKDRAERELQEKQEQEQKLKSLKMPHLTNLNEDSLLTGQLYYELGSLSEKDIHVGRSDGSPTPAIVFRGIGILPNHAYFSIAKSGEISLSVQSEEAFEKTLVNGTPLEKKNSLLFEASKVLNHMDRICFG